MTEETREPAEEPEEELPDLDYVDPMKRDPDAGETMPGADPVVSPIPPE